MLCGLYALDRGWKLGCTVCFFRRPLPAPLPTPEGSIAYPMVFLIQPITRGASGLASNLNARALLQYEGQIEHLLVCDDFDVDSQSLCRAFLEAWPELNGKLLLAVTENTAPASKVKKMETGFAQSAGEVICFIDDDIAPRSDNLTLFVRHLYQDSVGSVFGLACYTNWSGIGSTLMSLFVNANALPSYIPLTFLTEPYTITGHFFALRREVFTECGGMEGLNKFISEDHEIARRVRTRGLRLMQTSALYDVENELPTMRDYHRQMTRWFVFTGRILWNLLTPAERGISALGSLSGLAPPLLLIIALIAGTYSAWAAFAVAILLAYSLYLGVETLILRRHTPYRYLPLLLYTWLFTPLQVLQTLCSDKAIWWRGQRLRIFPDGTYEVLR